MTSALSDLRESVGVALTGDGVFPEDATVLVDTVDSLTPPAYLLVWGTPWMVPATFCVQTVRLDVVCIAGRIDPAPGVETLETMVAVALNRLRDARYPEATVQPPGPYEVGGVRYLAARVSIDVRVTVPEPLAAPISTGGATLTATAVLVVTGSTSAFPSKSGAAVLVSVATLTVTGVTPGTSTGAATLTSAGTLTATASATAWPTSTGAATLTSAGTLTAAGATFTSGAWTPASLPGIAAWYDGADTASITATGSPLRVSQWNDKSGNVRHLVQATSSFQPASENLALLGHNVVNFDNGVKQLAAAMSLTQPVTIYAVLSPQVIAGSSPRWIDAGGAGSRIIVYSSGGVWTVNAGTATATGLASATTPQQQFIVFNGASSAFYDNGTQYGGTLNPGTAAVPTSFRLGDGDSGNNAMQTGIAEVAVQAGVGSASDRAAWEAYVAPKWFWNPSFLPGLAAWYDASDAASITATAGKVSQWADKSGNGRHLAQATGANQPSTGVDTMGGRNALSFVRGGTGAAAGQWLARPSVTLPQPLTVFAAMKPGTNAVAAGNTQILGNAATPEATIYGAIGAWSMFAGANLSGGGVNAVPHQAVAVFNSTTSQLFMDGSSLLGPGNVGTGGRTELTIGSDAASSGWDGDIAEVAIISGIVTAGDRANWNAYCSAKWGTP